MGRIGVQQGNETVNENCERNEGESVLDWLSRERVFTAYTNQRGYVEICERCDDFFSLLLTPDEVRELANELLALVEDK